jgi:hypothetical protein
MRGSKEGKNRRNKSAEKLRLRKWKWSSALKRELKNTSVSRGAPQP